MLAPRAIVAILFQTMAAGCLIQEDCYEVLEYRSIELAKWCRDSGACKYNGHGCPEKTPDECASSCAETSPDPEECTRWCVIYSNCSFGNAWIGADTSFEYPIANLGAARDGLSVLQIDVSAGAPLSGVKLRLIVDGQVVCTDNAWYGDRDASISCELLGTEESVRLEVLNPHPAFSVHAVLREPSPTQRAKLCGD